MKRRGRRGGGARSGIDLVDLGGRALACFDKEEKRAQRRTNKKATKREEESYDSESKHNDGSGSKFKADLVERGGGAGVLI